VHTLIKWDHGQVSQGVLISEVSLLVRCPDFSGLNVCMLRQIGPWTSVLII